MQAELPEERIEEALIFYNALGKVAKVGFEMALATCGCHVCKEILGRIGHGELR